MSLFWTSWWTKVKHEDERPLPFKTWVSGWKGDFDKARVSLCALIEAPDETAAQALVTEHFPDAELRFCNEKPAGWTPGDRFK